MIVFLVARLCLCIDLCRKQTWLSKAVGFSLHLCGREWLGKKGWEVNWIFCERLQLRRGGQLQHLVHAAAHGGEQWLGVGLRAGFPRWGGGHDPGGHTTLPTVNCLMISNPTLEKKKSLRMATLETFFKDVDNYVEKCYAYSLSDSGNCIKMQISAPQNHSQ